MASKCGGELGGGLLHPARAVFGGGGARVAQHAARGDVAREPGESGGRIFRQQQFWVRDVRDVVDGVGGAVDQFGHRRQQERRFHFAGVETVGPFLRR